MRIEALQFEAATCELKVLDQTSLPLETKFKEVLDTRDGFQAIKDMLVRGAPCIAAVGCLSMVTEMNNKLDMEQLASTDDLVSWLRQKSDYLIGSRPTAVNLKQALDRLERYARDNKSLDKYSLRSRLTRLCTEALARGRQANERLGQYGAEELLASAESGCVSVLTHCNTGALATVGHGTALGVIRSLHALGKLKHAYCTETRPYNQGSRLTAWELVQERIPSTLVADSMVAYLMASRRIDAVVVGADRVAANGDTANKIGTLQIAVLAKHYGVRFYVAAPSQSIDLDTKSASAILIEQRPADELRKLGGHQLAPPDVGVWNPCFDVTPGTLLDGVITEYGVCKADAIVEFLREAKKSSDQEDALF